jgi:hypothetical protein
VAPYARTPGSSTTSASQQSGLPLSVSGQPKHHQRIREGGPVQVDSTSRCELESTPRQLAELIVEGLARLPDGLDAFRWNC